MEENNIMDENNNIPVVDDNPGTNNDYDTNNDFKNNNKSDIIEIELPFLKNLTGWATFKAIVDIITGALLCLGIITAVIGILQIMSAIRLLNATDNIKRYMSTGDTRNIGDVLYNFNKHFKFSGIALIIKIIFALILIVLYILAIVYFIENSGDIIDSIPGEFIPY